MPEVYSDDQPDKKSQFNSGLAILYRLDNLWKDAHRHARDVEYGKWNEDLDRIWLELSEDASDDDYKRIKDDNNKLLGLGVYGINRLIQIENPALFHKVRNMQKKILLEKEMFLRKLQNKQGKGGAYEDSIEDYMDDGF